MRRPERLVELLRSTSPGAVSYDAVLFSRCNRGFSRVMKTYSPKPREVTQQWFVVDATDQTLGRLATRIADVLRGKNKPQFAPHIDTGDYVIVLNAARIAVTGNKLGQKRYWRHSGYPGGIRSRTLAEMLERQPEEVVRKAVKGMLPRNKLGRAQLTKLKIYRGSEHPHEAQSPTELPAQFRQGTR